MENVKEEFVYRAHPVMFRNHPFLWTLFLILGFFVIGLVCLFVWWLWTKTNTLIITKEYVMVRRGLFNISETQVFHCDVSRVNVYQSLWGRMVNSGNIEIGSSATDDIDIKAFGYANPKKIRMLINSNR